MFRLLFDNHRLANVCLITVKCPRPIINFAEDYVITMTFNEPKLIIMMNESGHATEEVFTVYLCTSTSQVVNIIIVLLSVIKTSNIETANKHHSYPIAVVSCSTFS